MTQSKSAPVKSASQSIPMAEEINEMYHTANDMAHSRRKEINRMLNVRLASAIDLQMQMKQAHWNVKGPSFIGLHELFDRAYEEVEGYVDLIAERIVQFGGVAIGTVRASAKASHLEEYPYTVSDGLAHVDAVTKALSSFGREVRLMITEVGALEDAGTADIFTEISRGIDKMLWFVESHSQASS